MDIDTPLRDLGAVDIDDLRDAILSLDEAAWESQTYRQNQYEVHTYTKSIGACQLNLSRPSRISELQRLTLLSSRFAILPLPDCEKYGVCDGR